MKVGTARVVLLGEEFTLKGETDEVHLQRVATEVEALMRRISEEMNMHGQPSKVALLAALNLMDELTQLKRKQETMEREYNTALNHLVRKIENTLKAD